MPSLTEVSCAPAPVPEVLTWLCLLARHQDKLGHSVWLNGGLEHQAWEEARTSGSHGVSGYPDFWSTGQGGVGWLKVERNPVLERKARDTGLTRGCDFVLLCDHRPGISPRSQVFTIKRIQASPLLMDSSMDNHIERKSINSHQTLQSSLGSLVLTQDFLNTESPQPGSQARQN